MPRPFYRTLTLCVSGTGRATCFCTCCIPLDVLQGPNTNLSTANAPVAILKLPFLLHHLLEQRNRKMHWNNMNLWNLMFQELTLRENGRSPLTAQCKVTLACSFCPAFPQVIFHIQWELLEVLLRVHGLLWGTLWCCIFRSLLYILEISKPTLCRQLVCLFSAHRSEATKVSLDVDVCFQFGARHKFKSKPSAVGHYATFHSVSARYIFQQMGSRSVQIRAERVLE